MKKAIASRPRSEAELKFMIAIGVYAVACACRAPPLEAAQAAFNVLKPQTKEPEKMTDIKIETKNENLIPYVMDKKKTFKESIAEKIIAEPITFIAACAWTCLVLSLCTLLVSMAFK